MYRHLLKLFYRFILFLTINLFYFSVKCLHNCCINCCEFQHLDRFTISFLTFSSPFLLLQHSMHKPLLQLLSLNGSGSWLSPMPLAEWLLSTVLRLLTGWRHHIKTHGNNQLNRNDGHVFILRPTDVFHCKFRWWFVHKFTQKFYNSVKM